MENDCTLLLLYKWPSSRIIKFEYGSGCSTQWTVFCYFTVVFFFFSTHQYFLFWAGWGRGKVYRKKPLFNHLFKSLTVIFPISDHSRWPSLSLPSYNLQGMECLCICICWSHVFELWTFPPKYCSVNIFVLMKLISWYNMTTMVLCKVKSYVSLSLVIFSFSTLIKFKRQKNR